MSGVLSEGLNHQGMFRSRDDQGYDYPLNSPTYAHDRSLNAAVPKLFDVGV